MPSEDAELVTRAVAGSESAFRDLVLRYQKPVHGLIVRMVRDRGLAEDLSQEVFIKAYRALGTFDPKRKFSSWLFKIAHNTAIDRLRRRQIDTVPLESPDEEKADLLALLPDPAGESPDTRLKRRSLAEALSGAVGQLRVEYREVVVLRFQEGLAYEEIAEITGLPLGTVKTHLHRARKAMVRTLTAEGWGLEGLE
jgi:RNA polymerase sigma-70 factor (ECF subfamily)